jgi:TRAP-type C4-dicarboxylate transport system permease small subunit
MIFLLGFGLAHYEKAHIFVDVVYNLGSSTLKRVLEILGLLIALLSIVLVLPNAVEFAWRSFLIFERDSTIPLFTPPIWWYKWFLTFALLFALLQVIDSIINEVSDKRSKH